MLDPHHIISQGHAKKTGQRELISNPGNVVHICRDCHDQTTASMVRTHLEKRELPIVRRTLTKGALEARDKKAMAKAMAKAKAKGVTCGRCGITGHNRTTCNRYTTVDGVKITTKTWKYRPKAKAKKKVKAKRKTKSKAKAKAKKKRKQDFYEATTNYRDPFKPGPDPFKHGKDPFR